MKFFLQKILIASIACLLLCCMAKAQQGTANQLIAQLGQLKKRSNYLQDTAYANTLNLLAFIYADNYPDSAIILMEGQPERCKALGFTVGEADAYNILGNAFQTKGNFKLSMGYYEQAYQLAQKTNYQKTLPGILNNIGLIYMNQGNYAAALNKFYDGLKTAGANNNKMLVGTILNNIGNVHFFQRKMKEAEDDYENMLVIAKEMRDTGKMIFAYNNMGEVSLEQDSIKKALGNFTIAYNLLSVANNPEMLAATTRNLGFVFYKLDSLPKAIHYFETAIRLSKQQGNNIATCKALIALAKAQNKKGAQNEALPNGLASLALAEEMGQTQLIRDASEIVSTIYEALGNDKQALKNYQLFKVSSDSINNSESERAAATYKAAYEFSKKELEFKRKELQQRWLILSAFGALLSLGVIIWLVNRNRKKLHQANKGLQHKNFLVAAEKAKAEEALTLLKATQSQLIQSEKMASLGELTAGIAHEIQNPLNFVNNFSDVNKELLEEMKNEIGNNNIAAAIALANDIISNEEKISHHGKRADAIVKGMLQHSRGGNGIKEPTNINALVEESLRLSYNAFRGKDKSFNSAIQTNFDTSIEKATIVSQDIARVVLNLCNNAFYAVNEKKKLDGVLYEPLVSVTTKKTGHKIFIHIKDNGNGIPAKIADKIFQPFFTTKPTGQGTGLGLSLSHDIVTKGHGGELKVITEEGVGSEFVVELMG